MRARLAIAVCLLIVTITPTATAEPLPRDRAVMQARTPDAIDRLPREHAVTTNWHAELVAAIAAAQADQLARWYAWAAAQPAPVARQRSTSSAPSSSPTPSGAVGTGDADAAIRAHFGDLYASALGVARCESGLDPGAISPGGGNWGLFQINTVHRADFEQFTGLAWATGILNADANAAYARKLYDGSGWGPWACRWAA